MFEVNTTTLIQSSYPQQVTYISNQFIVPILTIVFIMTFFIWLVSLLTIIQGSKSKKKVLAIWLLNFVIGISALLAFTLIPITMTDLIKSLTKFLGG